VSWQTALLQAVVPTSGNRSYNVVTTWISQSWAKGSTYESLADSGPDAFVTLDMMLSTAMQTMIMHAGQDAKELRDLVSRKMEEAMKQYDILKGRQVVQLLLALFKTLDNSEIFCGFDHLASLVCGPDLQAFVTQWVKILENINVDFLRILFVTFSTAKSRTTHS